MNTPVNFELAKLLKEKGFEEISSNFYTNPRCKMFGIDEHGRYYPIKNKAKSLWISGNAATLDSKHVYYAPTIAEVVMWLYEKHGIWIEVRHIKTFNVNRFHVIIWDYKDTSDYMTIHCDNGVGYEVWDSPTEAYESGIKYSLEYLVV